MRTKLSAGLAALCILLFASALFADETPAAPSSARLELSNDGRFVVNWADGSDNEATFNISRAMSGSDAAFVAKVDANVTTFSEFVANLAVGVQYTYLVSACTSDSRCSMPAYTNAVLLPSSSQSQPQPPLPPPPPTSSSISLTVNGQDSIVSHGDTYTVAWASAGVMACTMETNISGSAGSTHVDPNTPGSFQKNTVGSYTFKCYITTGSAPLSKTVTIQPATTSTSPPPPPPGPPPPPPTTSPPPPSTNPPSAPTTPTISLLVNGQPYLVSNGERYTITYSSSNVQMCALSASLEGSSEYPSTLEPNTRNSFQNSNFGAYTFTCTPRDGTSLTKKVYITHSNTTPPSTATSTVPVNYYSNRDLINHTGETNTPTDLPETTHVEPVLPTTTTLPPVINTIKSDREVNQSSQTLEAVGRDVRRYEQTVTTQVGLDQSATMNPTLMAPGVSDAPPVIESVSALKERDGLGLYTDSDHDGVSDYDEVHLYGTDPRNAHTAGDVFSDGERVARGLDARTVSSERVAVESPIDAGTESKTIFEVTAIKVESVSVTAPVQASSTTHVTTSATSTPNISAKPIQKTLSFEGRGLPNSFVTLYIYSTPVVVTVKTDESGNWKYTLDSEIPDGSHQLYVAMVNNDGRIVAKSPPVPFIKRAEAVEFIPLTTPPITEPTLIDTLRDNMLVVAGFVLFLFVTVGLGILGIRKTEPPAMVA